MGLIFVQVPVLVLQDYPLTCSEGGDETDRPRGAVRQPQPGYRLDLGILALPCVVADDVLGRPAVGG